MTKLIILVLLVSNLWSLQLTFVNQLALEYVITNILIFTFSGLIIRNVKPAWIFMLSLLGLSFTMYPVLKTPHLDPVYYYCIELLEILLIMAILGLLWRERKGLVMDSIRLREFSRLAFVNAADGIAITGPDGAVLEYNPLFLSIWNLKETQLSEKVPLDRFAALTTQLTNHEDWVSLHQSLAQHPRSTRKLKLSLSQNKVLQLSTSPIFMKSQFLGRIWFFRDISAESREISQAAVLRDKLDRQNKALISLVNDSSQHEKHPLQVIESILKTGITAMDIKGAGFWRLQADSASLNLLFAEQLNAGFHPVTAFSQESYPEYFDLLSRLRITNLELLQDSGIEFPLIWGEDSGHRLDVPVRVEGKIEAILMLCRNKQNLRWTREDKHFATSLGDIIALNLESFERKRAEQNNEENLAVLKSVFEESGLGLAITNLSDQLISYNQRFREMWNYTDEILERGQAKELIAYAQAQMVDPSDSIASIRYLQNNVDENKQDVLELNNGMYIERFTEILKVGTKISGRIWYFRDITAQRKAEKALRESEYRNRAIVEAMPDLTLRVNQCGEVLDLKNPEILNLSLLPDDSPGQQLGSLFPERMTDQIMEAILQSQRQNQILSLESELIAEGQKRDLEIRVTDAGPREALILIRDVSERKAAERELIQRNFELDSFVYRASHDLKAPLNSIMGLLEIMQREKDQETIPEYLHLMQKSVTKLDTFIANLNAFSRVARLEVSMDTVNLRGLVEEIKDSLSHMEGAAEVEFQLVLDQKAAFITDRFHLEIVLSNLLSNSIKYQDQGKQKRYIRIHGQITDSLASIKLEDNGIGIPKQHLDRLFELFYRASNQAFGSGIGLYITKNAIEKLKGAIRISSEEGKGTTFFLNIPNHQPDHVLV